MMFQTVDLQLPATKEQLLRTLEVMSQMNSEAHTVMWVLVAGLFAVAMVSVWMVTGVDNRIDALTKTVKDNHANVRKQFLDDFEQYAGEIVGLKKRMTNLTRDVLASNFEQDKRMTNLEQDRDVADTERLEADTERLELEESINGFKHHFNTSLRSVSSRLHELEQKPAIKISPITVRDYVEAALALKTLAKQEEEDAA